LVCQSKKNKAKKRLVSNCGRVWENRVNILWKQKKTDACSEWGR
jgi:hypothetical protein